MNEISVIIPTFEPKEYLWECLDSMKNQTLSKEQYEVIIILNGIKEPYYSSINIYIQKNGLTNNFKLLYTEIKGVSNARNIGIDISTGKYLTFVDDDDYVSESYLKSLLSVVTPSIVALSNIIAFSDQTKESVPHPHTECFKKNYLKQNIKYSQVRKYFSGPVAKLVHRDIIGNSRYNVDFRIGEDSLFFFTISKNMDKVAFTIPEAIYYRRFREDSTYLSSKGDLKKRFINLIKLTSQYIKIFCKGFPQYNFCFFCTRLLGGIRSAFTKNHYAYSRYVTQKKRSLNK